MPPDLEQVQAILPEILLTAWGLVVLLLDVGPLRNRSLETRRTALGAISIVGALAVLAMLLIPVLIGSGAARSDLDPSRFGGTIADDLLTQLFNGLIALLLAMVVGLSMARGFTEHWGAFFALLLWAAVGMMILIAAEELLLIFLALEMMTICLYLASAFEKGRRRSSEAALKYFVYGSVASSFFVFGLSLLFGIAGTTQLDGIRRALLARAELDVGAGLVGDLAGSMAMLLVLVGFGFKVAAVPFHQWAPDAYEGAPAPVSAWIASGSKVAAMIALMKVFLHAIGPWEGTLGPDARGGWVALLALVAAATMTFGNLAALPQRNLKRLLAYSSIAHAGTMLVGVVAAAVTLRGGPEAVEVAGAVLFYLAIYAVTTVGAFGLAAWLSRDLGGDDIDDLDGLGAASPALAACVAILMLSLIGVPPLAGFFAKLSVFMEVLNAPSDARGLLMGLVALALVNTVISAFYYARVLRAIFLRRSDRPHRPAPRAVSWPIVLATLAAVGFGLRPAPLADLMRAAAGSMLRITLPPRPTSPMLDEFAEVPTPDLER